MGVYGNATGGFGMPKTFVLVDENNNELTGVVTGEEIVFTAGLNDIRAGKVAANAEGVVTGTKDIPSYNTTEGRKLVPAGSQFVLSIPNYDYTRLQAIICSYNTTLDDSVATEKVVINDNVYGVQSTTSIAVVQKNDNGFYIDFGISNTSDQPYLIRYFTYKEIL